MGKALKIIFYALVIALLFLWALTVAEKCKNKQLNTDQTEVLDDNLLDEDFSDELGDLTEDLTDDEFEDLSTEVEETDNKEEESFEDLASEEAVTDFSDLTTPVEEEKPVVVQTPPKKPSQGVSSGQFLLVAGNYSVHSNAQQMISKLKRMGYDKAEIVQFDNSSFSTVVASRFDDYDKATSAKAALISRGIDCYVHKQKF